MFQKSDNIAHVENPSFTLKLVEDGKFLNSHHVQTDFSKGQEFAAWAPAFEKAVAAAVEDAEYGDTYEAKYVGFNPSYDRSTDDNRVFRVYNVNNDSGEEEFLGKVRVENVTSKHQDAFRALQDIAQTAEHPDEFEDAFEELQARIHQLAVLGTNVDGIVHDTDEALLGSGWELFQEYGRFSIRRELDPLDIRISIENARLDYEHEKICIAFAVALDGKVVCSTLEWLDDNLDMVRDDRNMHENPDHEHTVAAALGSDADEYDERSDEGLRVEISGIVDDKIVDALGAMKDALIVNHRIDEFWCISGRGQESMYGVGSEATARDYCDLLDERYDLEFDDYRYRDVSLREAFGQVNNYCDLIDAIDALKIEMEQLQAAEVPA